LSVILTDVLLRSAVRAPGRSESEAAFCVARYRLGMARRTEDSNSLPG